MVVAPEPARAAGPTDIPGPVTRDVVVIGASAGGVDALQRVMRGLPADFGASVLVVLHLSASGSRLADILDRAGPLPARWAASGDPIRPGEVLVARPDHHLTVVGDTVEVARGPRENSSRPSVDVLFRSAARALGPRVVGVVLSGALDDGAAGLAAIARAGGVTVVQDPQEAQQDRMPRAALAVVPTAERLGVDAIAAALAGIVGEPVAPAGRDRRAVGPLASQEAAFRAAGGSRALTCPDCGGPLLHVDSGVPGLQRYVCRVGHAYSDQSLVEANGHAVERALWTAVQTLEERAELTHDLARRALERRQHLSAAAYGARAADAATAARVVRDVIARGATAAPDADATAPQDWTAVDTTSAEHATATGG